MSSLDRIFVDPTSQLRNIPLKSMGNGWGSVSMDPADDMNGVAMGHIMRNSIVKITESTGISADDIYIPIEYTMNTRCINYMAQLLCKKAFGLQCVHSFTHERGEDLKKFKFIYKVNVSPPAQIVNNNPPEVRFITIIHKVEFDAPLQISVGVDKEVYQRMRRGFEEIQGLCLDDALKMYAGEDVIVPTDLYANNMKNYIASINLAAMAQTSSLVQAESARVLDHIFKHSPNVYWLPTRNTYVNNLSNASWAKYIVQKVPHFLFGVNKLPGLDTITNTQPALAKVNASNFLSELLDMFILNTSPA